MKRLKRAAGLILAAVMLVSAAAVVYAAVTTDKEDSGITVKVEGEEVVFPDQGPVIQDDRTLVPVRFVAENLGYRVDYDADEHSAVIDGGRIVMYIGTDQAEIDGQRVQLDISSILMNDRTMVPLRVIAETLGCTVDWVPENRTVLVNRRSFDGTEKSVFDRMAQSGLFWQYSTAENDYLVPRDRYESLEAASDPDNYDAWWVERPRDKTNLDNQALDCSIVARTFEPETLAAMRDLLYIPYPTASGEVYDLLLKSVKGELWQTFCEEDSEHYLLYSMLPPRSGTFGSYYRDNREVEIYVMDNCTRMVMNISAEGYENPEIPRTLTPEEKEFYTNQAKDSYMLSLWGLD